MKKQDFLHLQMLLGEVRKYFDERMYEDQDLEGSFSYYDDLGVKSGDYKVSKSNKKEAVLRLANSFSNIDFFIDEEEFQGQLPENLLGRDDEEIVSIGGEILKRQNVSRPEAARLISDNTDFTEDTVYSKFSDYGINFVLHGDEKRENVIQEMESYASNGEKRSEALQTVSDEYDVPEGTLKNWLTDAEITFTEDVSLLLEPDSRKELFETAEFYFDIRNNTEPMEQALDKDRDTLRKYKNGEIKSVPEELIENLESLIDSKPRYRLDNPEKYVNEESWRGVVLEDDFQNFLFSHISRNEFEEMTDQSKATHTRYRQNNTKYVDEESFRKVFQTVSYMYSKEPEILVQREVDRNSYTENSGLEKTAVGD
jgi:hypothetical protein